MKTLERIALADLENDKLYLLSLTEWGVDVSYPDLKIALGAEIKQFVLAENEYLFEEEDDLTDEEKLLLIEETDASEIVPSAFILP
jgi:hypothetical protein